MPIRPILAWVLVAGCAAWAAVRLLGLERGFPLVPLVAYTPIAAGAAVGVAVLVALLRQRAAALVAAALALALVAVVVPRALGGPTEPAGGAGPVLRVLTVNMLHGSGSPEALAALVRRTRADVVSVQELTPALAAELDRAGFSELLPERVLRPLPSGDGIGLYARVPLRERPAPGPTVKPLVVAEPRIPGAAAVELLAVHMPAPVRDLRVSQWRTDLRALPAASPRGPVRILAGDFNATLDHAELRSVLDRGYEDAATTVGDGLRATWPSGGRRALPVAIDHVLADRRCGVRAVGIHTIPGSDHRAVVAELVLPRG